MKKRVKTGIAGIVVGAGALAYSLIDKDDLSNLSERNAVKINERYTEKATRDISDLVAGKGETAIDFVVRQDVLESEPEKKPRLKCLEDYFAKNWFEENFIPNLQSNINEVLRIYQEWRKPEYVTGLKKSEDGVFVKYGFDGFEVAESLSVKFGEPSYSVRLSKGDLSFTCNFGNHSAVFFNHFKRGGDLRAETGMIMRDANYNKYYNEGAYYKVFVPFDSERQKENEGLKIHESFIGDMERVVFGFEGFVNGVLNGILQK